MSAIAPTLFSWLDRITWYEFSPVEHPWIFSVIRRNCVPGHEVVQSRGEHDLQMGQSLQQGGHDLWEGLFCSGPSRKPACHVSATVWLVFLRLTTPCFSVQIFRMTGREVRTLIYRICTWKFWGWEKIRVFTGAWVVPAVSKPIFVTTESRFTECGIFFRSTIVK